MYVVGKKDWWTKIAVGGEFGSNKLYNAGKAAHVQVIVVYYV